MTETQLVQVMVEFYTRKDGVLMKPTLGVLYRSGTATYAVSVAHTLDERDGLEIWTGVHPDVVSEFDVETTGTCVGQEGSPIVDAERDLMAVPVAHDGLALAPTDVQEYAPLLWNVLIAVTDYLADEDGLLRPQLAAVAGPLSYRKGERLIVSAAGTEGMSGAPAFVLTDGTFRLLGFYLGTPGFTPLTKGAVLQLAQLQAAAPFLSGL